MNMSDEWTTAYDISHNEEIIGIYGTLNGYNNKIISFGFMVKTAQWINEISKLKNLTSFQIKV